MRDASSETYVVTPDTFGRATKTAASRWFLSFIAGVPAHGRRQVLTDVRHARGIIGRARLRVGSMRQTPGRRCKPRRAYFVGDTREEITISRQEVEASQRPVLVALVDPDVKLRAPTYSPDRLDAIPAVSNDKLLIPLTNIGNGPALSVAIQVSIHGRDQPAHGAVAHLAKQETSAAVVEVHGMAHLQNFNLYVSYRDLAGKGWTTYTMFINPRTPGGLDGYTGPHLSGPHKQVSNDALTKLALENRPGRDGWLTP